MKLKKKLEKAIIETEKLKSILISLKKNENIDLNFYYNFSTLNIHQEKLNKNIENIKKIYNALLKKLRNQYFINI